MNMNKEKKTSQVCIIYVVLLYEYSYLFFQMLLHVVQLCNLND